MNLNHIYHHYTAVFLRRQLWRQHLVTLQQLVSGIHNWYVGTCDGTLTCFTETIPLHACCWDPFLFVVLEGSALPTIQLNETR